MHEGAETDGGVVAAKRSGDALEEAQMHRADHPGITARLIAEWAGVQGDLAACVVDLRREFELR